MSDDIYINLRPTENKSITALNQKEFSDALSIKESQRILQSLGIEITITDRQFADQIFQSILEISKEADSLLTFEKVKLAAEIEKLPFDQKTVLKTQLVAKLKEKNNTKEKDTSETPTVAPEPATV